MLKQELLYEIEQREAFNEFYSAIAICEYYAKQAKMSSYIQEAEGITADDIKAAKSEVSDRGKNTSNDTSSNNEGFFSKIWKGIQRAFEAVKKFFANLFKRNEKSDPSMTVQQIDQQIQEEKKKESKEEFQEKVSEVLEKKETSLSPEQKSAVRDLLVTWFEKGRIPNKVTPEVLNAMNEMISVLNHFADTLNSPDIKTAHSALEKMVNQMETNAAALSKALNAQTLDDAATAGVKLKKSKKLIKEMELAVSKAEDAVVRAIQDEEKMKSCEELLKNVTGPLKAAMSFGKSMKTIFDTIEIGERDLAYAQKGKPLTDRVDNKERRESLQKTHERIDQSIEDENNGMDNYERERARGMRDRYSDPKHNMRSFHLASGKSAIDESHDRTYDMRNKNARLEARAAKKAHNNEEEEEVTESYVYSNRDIASPRKRKVSY